MSAISQEKKTATEAGWQGCGGEDLITCHVDANTHTHTHRLTHSGRQTVIGVQMLIKVRFWDFYVRGQGDSPNYKNRPQRTLLLLPSYCLDTPCVSTEQGRL